MHPAMTSSTKAVLCRYRYDPLDRLISSTPAGQDGIQRFYQRNRLATEIQGAVQRSVFQHEDLLLAQQRRVDGVVDTTLLATNLQRSVLQLVDKAGAEPVTYSPYGHHPAESGLTSLLGFNGERRDPVTGHYLLGNGYRAYNPVLMRFNSPDSLSPFGEGGLNAYGYVGGDPVGFGDETGHIKLRIIVDIARRNSNRSLERVIKRTPIMKGPPKLVESMPSISELSYTRSLPPGMRIKPSLNKSGSVGWSGGEITTASTSGARHAVLDSSPSKLLSNKELVHHRYVQGKPIHMFDEHGLPVSAQRIKNAYKEKFESARAMQGHYQMNYKKNERMRDKFFKYTGLTDRYWREYASLADSVLIVRGPVGGS
ncbi:YD repeat protein [Pseudomonas coronafaciens pv. atropurpurea]|nr:YD repeat protein [Pseudomonas coronafaciens pv. atropurpurea]